MTATVLSTARSRPLPMPGRGVRLGFLGLGWIGRKRLDAMAMHDDVELAVLCDASRSRLDELADAHPRALRCEDLDAMWDARPDGVVIATPNALHAAQAIACLARGIAVFCQKPLGVDAHETEAIIAAARRADLPLGVDFCYRHVQGMTALREHIAAGTLGEIVAIDLHFHNAYGPDKTWCHDRAIAGGGCLLDLGVHLIDLALWLQDEPELALVSSALFASGERLSAGASRQTARLEDLAYAEFRQRRGAIVRIACSWHQHAGAGAAIGMHVQGTRAGAAWANVAGSFYDFRVDLLHGTRREPLGSHPDDWGGRALRQWVDRLAAGARFDSSTSVIATGARLIDAIYAQ